MPSPRYSSYVKSVFIFLILLIAVYPKVCSEDIDQLSELTVPISVYILDDRDGTYSSERSKEEIVSIFEKVNRVKTVVIRYKSSPPGL